ncbi:MAG TPA: arginine--tRNA ligase [Solirubrobacteraceae bacterium]
MTEPIADEHTTSAAPGQGPSAVAPLDGLREAVLAVAAELVPGATPRGTIALERAKRPEFGDYSTNAALLLAPAAALPPRDLAERLGAALAERLGVEQLARYEVAGPGFLNLFLADGWMAGALARVLAAGRGYGAGGVERPERVLVEFVSANPTGPMHVGHARNASYGDSLARILNFHGHRVEREFYVNDAGSQIVKFGETIGALARGEPVPEGGYKGDYVPELVARIDGAATMEPLAIGKAAVELMLDAIKAMLERFGVLPFDNWYYESALHEGEPSPVARVLALLADKGESYESDGALWLRTTDYGDDKDRVLIRSNGEHTYFASDIAYHQDKRERGFERQLDVWGADHHGYVARMKAAYAALGGDPDELDLLIMQLVHLVSSGERAQMSKRAGEFVTLEELIEEVGVDAARWYLLARSHDTTVDLDLDLARERSSENPVYYVQYAHARIASLLAKAGEQRVEGALEQVGAAGHELHASERALINELLAFPGEVADSAMRHAPHRISAYALALAQSFTAFYRDCHVVGAEPVEVESFRIALSVASMRTIASCLQLLGISAPERM